MIGFKKGKQRGALILRTGNGTLGDPLGDRNVDTMRLKDIMKCTRLLVLGKCVREIVLRTDPAQIRKVAVPIGFSEAVCVDDNRFSVMRHSDVMDLKSVRESVKTCTFISVQGASRRCVPGRSRRRIREQVRRARQRGPSE